MNLDADLLAIIVCPACHAKLEAQSAQSSGHGDELVCQGCGLAYPVRDDIPVLLVDEARKPG